MTCISRRRLGQFVVSTSLCLAGHATALPETIDESGFERIGGIDQWITIQGQDRRNPVILYLHGGPSEAQSPFLSQFLSWQRDFTVVNWDQRGAGKAFGRNGTSTPDMTLDRLAEDAAEIAELVRTRLSQRKVILVGQSWGSFLGVHVIKRHPELFHCFVGTGLVASYQATVADRVAWARQKAIETGDRDTLEALDKAASLTKDLDRGNALAKAAGKYILTAADQPYAKMVHGFLGKPPYPKGDIADYANGNRFSSDTLGRSLTAMELRTLGLDMPVPFFVVQGRDDHIVGFEPAKDYVEEIRAPAKAFVPIDGDHYACFTNAEAFVGVLRKLVRPLAA